MPQIVAFGQPKGGVGKSTLAVHFAVIRAREGARVLLVDADANFTAARWVHDGEWEASMDNLTVAASEADHLATLREREDFDLIVIDLPGVRGETFTELVKPGAVDLLVTPSRCSVQDIEVLPEVLSEVQVPTLTVLTLVSPHGMKKADEWRDHLTRDGWTIARTTVRQYAAWQDARAVARLVIDRPTHPNAKADALGVVGDIKEALK